ncbi:putative ethanolamine utilization protein [Cryphonectria parasitica EP155]|uniref:Ethanolamine utilization protein n=1 Tax=Cryphonectria parasitica (strain ATCC 38755 / EP155) TaxID=660469 RepID=A0A9P4XZL6_CRYP1|nr:putative ethanolamine utilization protein [Cryphonectria parasitica EP155]KAF3763440.1 putative ethanolamine utilization protein [Cryphonectria parasitica EP155]
MATESKPVTFQHYAGLPASFSPQLLANENAYLEDLFSSEATNAESPLSSGIFRLEPGTPLKYTYTYDEMKIILDGDFTIVDETGQTVHAKKGDHFFFPKGVTITFTSEKGGVAFYVGQRKKGAA